MLGYREWRVRISKDGMLQPILQSVYMQTLWPESVLTADAVPLPNGAVHGVHAVVPEYQSTYLVNLSETAHWNAITERTIRALGAVDLYGTIQLHEDGVVRAEHARILALNVVVTPGFSCCACGVLTVVEDRRTDGYLKLRSRCGDGCGSRALKMLQEPVAELSVTEVAAALRRYYEVAALPVTEGPWYRKRC